MEKEFLLEKYKANLQGWLHSSQAMVDFSKMSLRGAMLLNGAGIIPIVYSKVEYLYDSALLFGLGALLAACASGVTYLAQWAITASWRYQGIAYPLRTLALDQAEEQAVREARRWEPKILWLRVVAIAFLCASLFFFAWGLYSAHAAITAIQAQEQPAAQAPAPQANTQPQTASPSCPACCCLDQY